MRFLSNLSFLLLFSYTTLLAQSSLQELSLEDAVLRQRSTLAPKRINDLQWMASSDYVSFVNDDRSELLRQNVESLKTEKLATLIELNAALELAMKHLPRIQWINVNEFFFRYKNTFYTYNISTRKGNVLLQIPDAATNVDFNPTNKMAAFTIDNNLFLASAKEAQMRIFFSKDPNIVTGQAIARYEFGISKGTFWSPQGNLLAYYQKDESDVADYPILDISTTPGTLRSIKYPMAGQKSEYAKVGIYNSLTHKNLFLEIQGPKDQYLTNLTWSPDEAFVYLALVNRDQNHMWLNQYDASTGKFVKTLFEEKHPKYVEPEKPIWFIPGKPDEFLWLSERDGFMHLYHYHSSGKLIKQLTKGNWTVLDILGLSHSGKKVIIKGTDQSGLNQYAYAVNLKNGKTKKLSKKSGVHFYQLNENGVYIIDQYSSLKTPFVADIINSRGKKVNNLLASPDPLLNYKIGKTEILDLQAKDGTTLHARSIKPYNFDSRKKYPVLIYVYGGPHAQMVSNRRLAGAPLWMHYMANKGYIIFTLDGRGSANRGFDFENAIHRNLGSLEVDDQMVGVQYLKKLPFVDGESIGVHGWSYGGFMTISMMLKRPEVFKVGVAGGPVTDWKYYEVMYGERYMDRPQENPEGYKEASLLTHANKLKGDLLLIHGTADDVVVMQHNLALIQKFVQEGIQQVDFFPYPMHPHNVRGKDRVHLMTKVLNYIDEHLKSARK